MARALTAKKVLGMAGGMLAVQGSPQWGVSKGGRQQAGRLEVPHSGEILVVIGGRLAARGSPQWGGLADNKQRADRMEANCTLHSFPPAHLSF